MDITLYNYSIFLALKYILIGILLFLHSLHAQSVRYGIDESNLGVVSADDFDFAGVWQANRFEVVYDNEQQEVVTFEFRDSINDIVFIRMTRLEEMKAYMISPMNQDDLFPIARIGLLEGEYICIGSDRDSSYIFSADVKLYGADALHFNEDVPENEKFFGHHYKNTEDLNIFWELIRSYPD